MEFNCKNMFPQFQTTKLLEAFHNSVQATSPVLFPATSNTLDTLKHSVFSHACLASCLSLLNPSSLMNSQLLPLFSKYLVPRPPSWSFSTPQHFVWSFYCNFTLSSECFLGTYRSIPSTSLWGPWVRKSCVSHLWHRQHFILFLQYSRWSFKDLLNERISQPYQWFQTTGLAFSSKPQEPFWWSS